MLNTRLAQLQSHLQPNQAILFSAPPDLAYFARFITLLPEEREGFFVVTKNECYLIKATFSPLPAIVDYQVLEPCRLPSLTNHLRTIISNHNLNDISLDYSSLFVDEYLAIQKLAEELHLNLAQLERNDIWQQRMIKDENELLDLRLAGQYGVAACEKVLQNLQTGVTEKQIANQIEIELLNLGADRSAFPTIVAFGAHTAEPHYQPGNVALQTGMPVLIDMGAMVHGYRSDLTRSVWFGESGIEDRHPE